MPIGARFLAMYDGVIGHGILLAGSEAGTNPTSQAYLPKVICTNVLHLTLALSYM